MLPGKTTRILLLDDSVVLAHAMRELFADRADVTLRYCWDPADALAEAEIFEPTVIVQSLALRGMGGLTLLRQLSGHPTCGDVPVLAISLTDDPALRREAFRRGARDFVAGVPDPIELRVRVMTLSDGCRAARERDQAYRSLRHAKAELENQNSQLMRASTLDTLTGLPSVAVFNQRLAEEFGRAVRDGSALSILIVDIEDLDGVVASYGLRMGDEVLRSIARVLEACVKRAGDHFARFSDSQFVLVLPDTGEPGAATMASYIRAAIDGMRDVDEADLVLDGVRVSVGGATAIPAACDIPERLIAVADEALAAARRGTGVAVLPVTPRSRPMAPVRRAPGVLEDMLD